MSQFSKDEVLAEGMLHRDRPGIILGAISYIDGCAVVEIDRPPEWGALSILWRLYLEMMTDLHLSFGRRYKMREAANA